MFFSASQTLCFKMQMWIQADVCHAPFSPTVHRSVALVQHFLTLPTCLAFINQTQGGLVHCTSDIASPPWVNSHQPKHSAVFPWSHGTIPSFAGNEWCMLVRSTTDVYWQKWMHQLLLLLFLLLYSHGQADYSIKKMSGTECQVLNLVAVQCKGQNFPNVIWLLQYMISFCWYDLHEAKQICDWYVLCLIGDTSLKTGCFPSSTSHKHNRGSLKQWEQMSGIYMTEANICKRASLMGMSADSISVWTADPGFANYQYCQLSSSLHIDAVDECPHPKLWLLCRQLTGFDTKLLEHKSTTVF